MGMGEYFVVVVEGRRRIENTSLYTCFRPLCEIPAESSHTRLVLRSSPAISLSRDYEITTRVCVLDDNAKGKSILVLC